MDNRIRVRSLDTFETRERKPLFPPFIYRGVLTVVAGEGGAGKSVALYDILARVTNGDPMPQFGNQPEHKVPRGKVVILSKENDPGSDIKPRLAAAGADMRRVKIIGRGDGDDFEVIDRLDDFMGTLEEIIAGIGNVRVLMIDPITDFAGKLNLYRDDQIRQLLGPLAQLAARYEIAVVIVIHLNKHTSKPVRHRVLGGVGLLNVPRQALIVAKAPEGDRRYLSVIKTNQKSAPIVAFRIDDHEGEPKVEWEHDWQDVDIDALIKGRGFHVTKQQRAALLLRARLVDGPVSAKEIELWAEKLGMHFNTVKAAKKEIGAKSQKRDDGWWWKLPHDRQNETNEENKNTIR